MMNYKRYEHCEDLVITDIPLELKTYEIRRSVDESVVRSFCDMKRFHDDMTRNLIFGLRASIYGREIAAKADIKYPTNWKEALKERFFPVFLKKKYPVKYTRVVPIFEELYPNFQPSSYNHSPVIRLQEIKQYEVLSNQ